MRDEMERPVDSATYRSMSDNEDGLSNSSVPDDDDYNMSDENDENELPNSHVPDSDDYNTFDENDEWSYDANEALQIRDIGIEVDLLSRKFEEQIISTREEQMGKETLKVREKLISG